MGYTLGEKLLADGDFKKSGIWDSLAPSTSKSKAFYP